MHNEKIETLNYNDIEKTSLVSNYGFQIQKPTNLTATVLQIQKPSPLTWQQPEMTKVT